jgi:imidazolonepropionase
VSHKPIASTLIRHASEVLTMSGELPSHDVKGSWDPAPLGIIRDGAVALHNGVIVAVGTTTHVEQHIALTPDATVVDARGALVTPGLIDSHTHALFVGNRAAEYSLRIQGRGYADIAAAGGGIASSVRALRATDSETLIATLRSRIERMAAYGVSFVEVKTGYALNTADELRSLAAMQSVAGVVPTFLPLHAVPPELREVEGGRQRYLTMVHDEMLPAVVSQGIARFIDAYIDGPGFSVAEALPVLTRAKAMGLRARLHIGQFEDLGGAQLAAQLGAASADHLEHVSDDGLKAMAATGVVGVLLPGAAFSLGQPMPDARRMRALGVQIALATDCNPGTSRTENLPLCASFAVRQMGLTTVEAWWAITRTAAHTLELEGHGCLAVGAQTPVCVLDLESWEALPYAFGGILARSVFSVRAK